MQTKEKLELELKDLGVKINEKKAVVPGTYYRCFKTIMLKCRPFLISIIHHITNMPSSYLEEHLVLEDSEYETIRITEKDGRSDIVVKVEDSSIILEMDSAYHNGVLQKSLAYVSRNTLHQVKVGENIKI